MMFLNLSIKLILMESRIERRAIGHIGEIKAPAPYSPAIDIELGRSAIGIAPRIGGIIERGSVDDPPVEEVAARIVRLLVRVKHIDDAKLADCQNDARRTLPSGELDEVGIDLLAGPSKVDRLPQEPSRKFGIGASSSDLIGLAAWKAGNPERVAKAKALIDFWIDPDFGAGPGPVPGIKGKVERLFRVSSRIEAIWSLIGRMEGCVRLKD